MENTDPLHMQQRKDLIISVSYLEKMDIMIWQLNKQITTPLSIIGGGAFK